MCQWIVIIRVLTYAILLLLLLLLLTTSTDTRYTGVNTHREKKYLSREMDIIYKIVVTSEILRDVPLHCIFNYGLNLPPAPQNPLLVN